ncbi:hypothetical protein QYF36_026720 [Acer negundo]|nr:hypothetical protein QYF36_026720 [Acer negundo]
MTLSAITSKYPHIKAINFDLPHVINDAPSYPGVEHLSGDMFQSVPKGDAIILKWILNCWDDNNCLSTFALPGQLRRHLPRGWYAQWSDAFLLPVLAKRCHFF